MSKQTNTKKSPKTTKPSDEKEDKYVGMGMCVGLCIGTMIGSILANTFDDMMYVTYGMCCGMLVGIVIGATLSEEKVVIKKSSSHKANKKKEG